MLIANLARKLLLAVLQMELSTGAELGAGSSDRLWEPASFPRLPPAGRIAEAFALGGRQSSDSRPEKVTVFSAKL